MVPLLGLLKKQSLQQRAYVLLLSQEMRSQGATVRDTQGRKESQSENVLSNCLPGSHLNSVLRRVSPGGERRKNSSISFRPSLVKGLPKGTHPGMGQRFKCRNSGSQSPSSWPFTRCSHGCWSVIRGKQKQAQGIGNVGEWGRAGFGDFSLAWEGFFEVIFE